MPEIDDVLEELTHQLSIQNRITVARELLKIGYYEADDYIEALKDIDEELRM